MASPLVSTPELQEALLTDNMRVLDATWVPPFLKDRPNGRTLYAEAHIPGASYFDIDEIADGQSGLKHMLPDASQFAAQVSAMGISNTSHVIIYDQNGFFASARAWWMFRAMGHDQVQVLNGGLAAWRAAGGAVETAIPETIPTQFSATLVPSLVRGVADMRAHVSAQDTDILDARDPGRFNGTAPEPRPDLPSGHMPGSFCVPASALLTETKSLKSETDLRPILDPYLLNPVVTSCGSGVSAAVISLALAELGNWDAALYDGSWSEWAADANNPIETA
ncbi:MAG: sulfurtransferase [Pseudomonadota bacterium]